MVKLRGLSKGNAPERKDIPSLDDLDVVLHPDTLAYVHDSEALERSFGGSGPKDIFANGLVAACAMAACIGGFLFGFDQGLLSIVLVMPRFNDDFPSINEAVDPNAGWNRGIMTALLQLGAFAGAISSGFLADRYSRKASIGAGIIVSVIGNIIQTASHNYGTLVAGRFIGGVGTGILSSTAPMYISEVAPPNVRGAFLVMEQFAIVLGIVIMYWITYGTRFIENEWCYRLPFFLPIVPAIPFTLILWYLPFSPRWLAGKGRDKEAFDTLCYLRRMPADDPRVQAEWITIRAEAVHSREALVRRHPKMSGETGFVPELKLEGMAWIDMFKKNVIRRTMIGIAIMFFQQFVGINALIYYSPTLFQQLGLDSELQLIMGGVMNIAQLCAVIPAFFILDKVGRKPVLLFGSFGMTASHFIVGAMIARYSYDWETNQVQAWVGVAFIIAFMVFFGIGWGPVPWSMPAEVHSSSYRAKGVALATCSNWLNNFIIGLVTPPLVQNTGYGAFIFFGVFSVLSGLWTWFIAPETKGKTLEQMDRAFHSHTAQADLAAKHEIYDLMIPSNAYSSSRSELYSTAEGGNKALKNVEHVEKPAAPASDSAQTEKV